MHLPTRSEIEQAQRLVYERMTPTPQYTWPLLNQRLGTEAWLKHENHSPVGAFKLRGALVYIDWLKASQPGLKGVAAATRGNHGQGVAMAARLQGLKAAIVVPHGNNSEQSRAIAAQGAELIVHGSDFQASLEHAAVLAAERGYAMVESFHERLVMGTATYAKEFLEGSPALDRVYVPVGLGSSICGMAAARNALGLATEIVGVTAKASPSYAMSFSQHTIVEAAAETKIADGLACRKPNAHAMEIVWKEVSRITQVTEEEIAAAMRALFEDTHNLAEGAGASGVAAALAEKQINQGKRIGIVVTGSNVDLDRYKRVLAGER